MVPWETKVLIPKTFHLAFNERNCCEKTQGHAIHSRMGFSCSMCVCNIVVKILEMDYVMQFILVAALITRAFFLHNILREVLLAFVSEIFHTSLH